MEIKRKGIIFALDAALAVTVVIIILINSSYYFSTSSKESLSQLQPVRIGNDIIAILDLSGNFDYAFAQDLETHVTIPQDNLNVSFYLPKNYAMRYAITDMKETPTTSTYCPGSFCTLGGGASCDPTKCILPNGGSIKVKPFTTTTGGATVNPNIINQGEHFVAVKVTPLNTGLSASLKVDDCNEAATTNLTTNNAIFDEDTGLYYFYINAMPPFKNPYFEAGNSDNNCMIFTYTGTAPLDVFWFRVVGDESYMRDAFSEDGLTFPQDRFVGSGERFISIKEPDDDFEGYHLVRYWIWLKKVAE